MTEYTRNSRKRAPTHPGALLREEVLPDLGVSISQFARDIHVSRQTLHGILGERKPITPVVALKIGKYVGNGPNLWMKMQTAYDLYQAEQRMADELASIRVASAGI